MLEATAIAFLGTVSASTPLWLIGANMFMVGAGMSFVFLPNQVAAMATIARPNLGGASMLMSVQRQIGSAFGVALMSTVLSVVGVTAVREGVEVPNVDAYRAAFFTAAVLALVASLWAWRVPDEDAAETMQRG
jgi:MFS family permease